MCTNPSWWTPTSTKAPTCQSARKKAPGSACKKDPSAALGQACPGSEQEGPARVAQCPHERRSGARGRCLFAHRGKPGWHSRAVFEAPALVAGFDDFTMMGQTIEERGRHLGVAKHLSQSGACSWSKTRCSWRCAAGGHA